ncbi:MAG: ABC transporter [Halobacteriovoraceae bacterium]|nr:ABC transporter [Halobacteriovoraceae bacterium]|tara:strand:- start:14959 stop:16710 length:1752 start_codon:yes stop_codon:yes gene_type:complete
MIFSSIRAKYPRKFNITVIYTILNKVFDLAPPFLIGVAVDIVVKKEESLIAGFGIKDTWDQLVLVSILTVLVWALESFFEYLMEVGWRELAQTAQHDLRDEAFTHVLNLDLEQIESRSSGELMSILNDDINQLERFLNMGAYSMIQLCVTISVIGTAFFIMAPEVAVFGMMPIPFIILGSLKFQKFLEPKYKSVRDQVGLLNSEFSNSIQGIQTVKAFANEALERDKISQYSTAYMASNYSAIKISSLFTPLIRMLILCGFLVNLLYGGYLTLEGSLEVGTYSVLIFMIQRLLWPLTTLGQMLDLFQRSNASYRRVLDLLKIERKILSDQTPFSPSDQSIEISDLYFSYSEREPLFEGIDLKVNHGETVGLVGGTGSGKSTLVKIILRFYEGMSGRIRIGGIDIKELDISSLRKNIGYVGQDVYLFHGTILENIAYGSHELSKEDTIEIAKLAEAHEFITSLPKGYDTIVGERGHRLSGGQRQRISIARALVKEPSILILDEATSAVDNETEAAIQRSLARVKRGRTTIIIAHRLSTVVDADRIYVLEEGKIKQTGSHQELIAQGGIYKDLWNVQTGSVSNSF